MTVTVDTGIVQPSWTIDELCALTGTPSRTIREYRTVGVLMPPRREGRRGVYNAAHRDRLALIARLQTRGYSLAGIRDLLSAWDEGTSLHALVRGEPLGDTAFDEAPTHLTIAELTSRVEGMHDAAARARAVAAGLLVETPDGYIARSIALVDLVSDAVRHGASLDAALAAVAAIRESARTQAAALTELFVENLWQSGDTDTTLALVRRSRPRVAQAASSLVIDELGAAISRAAASDPKLGELIETIRIGAVRHPPTGRIRVNEDQVERWNGTEADHWCTNADRYDAQLAPFLDAIMTTAAIGDEAVLDVGCGCGALSFAAAPRADRVVGLDLSDRLLAVARNRAAQSPFDNVEFVRGDAQVWTADEPFDVLVSRFGVMFFDDPEQAFTSLRTNLRTGGRIVFASWQGLEHQAWLLEPAVAALAFLTPDDAAPASGPGMFGLADPSVVEALLTSTGFGEVSLDELRTDLSPGGPGAVAEAVDFFAHTGMARAMLAGASPEARADAIAAVTDVFAQHYDGTAVHMDSAAWIVSATAV